MSEVFIKLLNMSISASWLVLCVIILRLALKKAPRWIACVLWTMVAIRLLCPFSIESVLSLVPSAQTVPEEIIYSESPEIESGIPIVNSTVNPIISENLSPDTEDKVNPMEVVTGVCSVVWLIGIATMAGYGFISYAKIRKRVSEAVKEEKGIYICDRVNEPFILGLFAPRIILPSSLSGEDREYVISHERAHLSRMDHIWKPLGFALLSVYWFNPVLWIAYILLCRDIEAACDEKVIKQLGEGAKKPYASALINCSVPRRMISACPLAFGEAGVKERVRNVLNYKKPAFWIIIVAVIACIATGIFFLTDPKKEKEPDKDGNAVVDTADDETTAETTDSETTTDADTTDDKKDPDETTGAVGDGEETTKLPEETTGVPEDTTRVPEETTGKPIETKPPSVPADTTGKQNSKPKDTTDKTVTTKPPTTTKEETNRVSPEPPANNLLKKIAKDYYFYCMFKYSFTPHIDVGFYVSEYYGSYNNTVPVLMDGTGMMYADVITTETVAGYTFTYPNSNKMWVWNNGSFYSLQEAYDKGLLTKEDIGKIAKTKPIEYSLVKDNVYFCDELVYKYNEAKKALTVLDETTKDKISKAMGFRWNWLDNGTLKPKSISPSIGWCCGVFDGCTVLYVPNVLDVNTTINVANSTFYDSSGFNIFVLYNDTIYTIKEAYDNGFISAESVEKAAVNYKIIRDYCNYCFKIDPILNC